MSDHAEIRDLLAAAALGAATPDEHARVDRHVATCQDCRAQLDVLLDATAQLALDVPTMAPPPDLKRRVMNAVKVEVATGTVREPSARPRRWGWPALAGGMAVLALGLAAWNVSLRDDGGATRRIAVTAPAQPGVVGTVEVHPDGTAVMRVRGLPPLSREKGYELWTIRDGTPRSEGFAAFTGTGEIVVATADLAGATALALTPEARTNVTAPTVPPIVVATL